MSNKNLSDKGNNSPYPSKGNNNDHSGNKNDGPIQKGFPDSGDLGGRGATVPKTLRPPKKG